MPSNLAALQRRQPRRLVGNAPHHDALDARRLAPVALEGLDHQLDAGAERDELVGPGADRRLLETVIPDLFEVFLRHDPAGAGGAAVEGEEIGPRFLQLEPNMLRVERFDRRHALLHQRA